MLWSANGTPRNFCRRGQLFGAWKAVKVNDAESHRGPSRSAGESRRGRPSVAKRLLSTPVSPSPRFPTTRYWGHLSQVDTRLTCLFLRRDFARLTLKRLRPDKG